MILNPLNRRIDIYFDFITFHMVMERFAEVECVLDLASTVLYYRLDDLRLGSDVKPSLVHELSSLCWLTCTD